MNDHADRREIEQKIFERERERERETMKEKWSYRRLKKPKRREVEVVIETQLKKIEETLEGAIGENVTVNLWGYFFPEFEEGRTKKRALEIAATLIREFGFDAPSEVNHDGTRWLEVGNDPIRLVIYYTASLGEKIDEAEESLAKLKA